MYQIFQHHSEQTQTGLYDKHHEGKTAVCFTPDVSIQEAKMYLQKYVDQHPCDAKGKDEEQDYVWWRAGQDLFKCYLKNNASP
jgi:hypothetical protein